MMHPNSYFHRLLSSRHHLRRTTLLLSWLCLRTYGLWRSPKSV